MQTDAFPHLHLPRGHHQPNAGGMALAAPESTRLIHRNRSLEVGGSRVHSQLWDISRSHPLRVYAVGLARLAKDRCCRHHLPRHNCIPRPGCGEWGFSFRPSPSRLPSCPIGQDWAYTLQPESHHWQRGESWLRADPHSVHTQHLILSTAWILLKEDGGSEAFNWKPTQLLWALLGFLFF